VSAGIGHQRRIEGAVRYYLEYKSNSGVGSGAMFPCDRHGNVSQLTRLAADNLRKYRDGTHNASFLGVRRVQHDYWMEAEGATS